MIAEGIEGFHIEVALFKISLHFFLLNMIRYLLLFILIPKKLEISE